MRVKRYLYEAEWLNNIMIMLLWYVMAEMTLCVLRITLSAAYMLVIVLIMICSYLSRVYILKLPLFFGAHVLMYTVLFFIPIGLPYKFIGFIVLTAFTICDMMFWTGEGVRSFTIMPWGMVLVFLAVFAYATFKDYPELIRTSYVCGVCYIGLFFLRTYLLNCTKFANDMMISNDSPLDEMFKRNGRIVVPLVICLTAGMFLIQSDTLARFLSEIVSVIIRYTGKMIFFLISLLPEGEKGTYTVAQQTFMPDLEAINSVPEWIVILILALEKVAGYFLICLFIYMLIKWVYGFVIRYFSRNGYDIYEVRREDHTEVRERIRPAGRRMRRLFSGTTERDKIRHKYKRAVESMRRRGYIITRSHTPRERALDISNNDRIKVPEGFSDLTDKYEEVRYRE